MPVASIDELKIAINENQKTDSYDNEESYTYSVANIDSLIYGGLLCSVRY